MNNTSMDNRPLETLKAILLARGVKAESFETVTNPLDDTRMYAFGGVLIIFSEKNRITEKELNNFIRFTTENNYTAGTIIVSLTKPSEAVLKIVRDYIAEESNTLIQIFYISHLNFDISKHRKVSKHRIISLEEFEESMKKKNINIENPKQLPKIDCQDAMAKWIGARPGNIVEISGLCVASAKNERYRYCVANVYEL